MNTIIRCNVPNCSHLDTTFVVKKSWWHGNTVASCSFHAQQHSASTRITRVHWTAHCEVSIATLCNSSITILVLYNTTSLHDITLQLQTGYPLFCDFRIQWLLRTFSRTFLWQPCTFRKAFHIQYTANLHAVMFTLQQNHYLYPNTEYFIHGIS